MEGGDYMTGQTFHSITIDGVEIEIHKQVEIELRPAINIVMTGTENRRAEAAWEPMYRGELTVYDRRIHKGTIYRSVSWENPAPGVLEFTSDGDIDTY